MGTFLHLIRLLGGMRMTGVRIARVALRLRPRWGMMLSLGRGIGRSLPGRGIRLGLPRCRTLLCGSRCGTWLRCRAARSVRTLAKRRLRPLRRSGARILARRLRSGMRSLPSPTRLLGRRMRTLPELRAWRRRRMCSPALARRGRRPAMARACVSTMARGGVALRLVSIYVSISHFDLSTNKPCL